MLIFLTLQIFLASILQQTHVFSHISGKYFTDKVQLGSDVLCYRSFSVEPEDWEENIWKVMEESSNVCVRSELNDDLQSHQDFSRY